MNDKQYKVYRASGRRSGSRPTAGQLALSDELAQGALPLEHAAPRPRRRSATAPTRGEPRRGYDDRDGGDGDRQVQRGAAVVGASQAAHSATLPRARHRRWWAIPLVTLVVLLIPVIAYATIGYRAFASGVERSNRHVTKQTRAALTPDAGSLLLHPTTILVLGSDQRQGEPARSDTIMLMRVNPKTHTIGQLSIPRDMLVAIPGNGQSKINAAMAWGGPALTIRTVRQFTGIPVNHIMIMRMRGFPHMIDAVGGVDVYVPKTIASPYTGGRTVMFRRGWNHLDGKRASQYVRMRQADNDFYRMARQQQVIQALQKKISARDNLLRLPWMGKEMMRPISTDLSTRQLIELAYLKWRTPKEGSFKAVMKGTPTYIGGVSYVLSDKAANLRLIDRFKSR